MDLILLLILSLTSLSSFPNSVVANKSTKKPLTTPTILKTLTTTKPSTETGSSILLDTISTTTPLPKPINSSKSTNETKVNRSTKSDETGEILNGQEQAQSPYIRGRGRQNGFQPTLGPNYNPNYGLPFNAFIPQGLPFSGSQGSANNGLNRPGLFNARDQLNNNNNINNHNRQGQLTSPLDLLSGFIPTPGPGGPYTGTPTPFGQPVTGYPGYPNYPGLNPNYGPVNAPGLNNNGFGAARGTPNIYNQLGRPDAPETGLGAQGDNADGQEGEDGVDQGGVDGNSSNEDEGQEENGAEDGTENESGQPDNTGANDTEETGAQDDQGGEGGEGETGAGGGQGGEGGEGGDPSNDPDLAQFQNFQGGNFPGDLFPPGILSQQDLKDIQKSMDEQQKKEAEKKRQEEEGASAQPDYDYDDGTGKNNGEETSTETPANLNPNYNQPINQPVVPNHQNRLSHHQGLNNNHGAYANNNQLNHQINNQYNNRLNPGLVSNQRKSNPQNIRNYQQNQFDDNVGYNNPNNIRPVAGNQDYDYNGSGESGINQGPVRSKGDNNRYNNYKNGAYSSGETNDYDNNNGNNDQYGNGRTQSYPRGSNFNRFNQDSGRYRPGTFGQSGYRGENLRDFGGHSADSYQQNDVEPGVDYSPDPVYDSKRLRKQDKPRRLSVPNNRPINNGRNINRFSGIKPSVDYDGETRNYPGSTRKPFKVNAPTSVESSIQKPLIPSNHNPFIANHKWGPRSSEYDTSSVDYDEGENNTNGIGYTNLPKKPLNYDSSKADYTNDVDQLKDDNNSGQLTNYRQTPRFNASEKKEDKRLANSQIKTIDPFLRG